MRTARGGSDLEHAETDDARRKSAGKLWARAGLGGRARESLAGEGKKRIQSHDGSAGTDVVFSLAFKSEYGSPSKVLHSCSKSNKI